ncbi:hypothetical protein BLA29_013087 [Euroglyphus maynei]|uniref:Uncharacterized protein n=1 Tax=Euroglyphus maynei TaxID=6958 RepID=A0A1Y3BJG0_EURMA|nr:hypothetical protein BLA29_013087 [Euroglyphus maynei]
MDVQYQLPADHEFRLNFDDLSSSGVVKESNKGFVVRGAPWEKKSARSGGNNKNDHSPGSKQKFGGGHVGVDTTSSQDFPAFGLPTNNDLANNNASKMNNNNTMENNDNSPMNGSLMGEKNGDTTTTNTEQPIVWGPKRN